MIKINVITNNNEWNLFLKNPNSYIDRKINKYNVKDKKYQKKNIYCTLLLSRNKEIKNLNKKFRKKNKTTDVLSFPFHKKKELKLILNKEKEIYLGDIIVNLDKIKSQKNLQNFKIEFDQLWIHGLVHLLGYNHKKDKEYSEMSKIEKKFIELINV
jgi:probable rRNA maturation factor